MQTPHSTPCPWCAERRISWLSKPLGLTSCQKHSAMAGPSLADLLALDTSRGTTPAHLQRLHATPAFRGLKFFGTGHKQSSLLALLSSNRGQESTASCSPCVPNTLSDAWHFELNACSFTRSSNLTTGPQADFTARDHGAPHAHVIFTFCSCGWSQQGGVITRAPLHRMQAGWSQATAGAYQWGVAAWPLGAVLRGQRGTVGSTSETAGRPASDAQQHGDQGL